MENAQRLIDDIFEVIIMQISDTKGGNTGRKQNQLYTTRGWLTIHADHRQYMYCYYKRLTSG